MTELYQGFVTAASALSAIVLNALWQDALLVLCVWLLLRVWPRINASTRYTVWSATLAAALIVPVVTTLVFFAAPQTTQVSQPLTSHTSGVAPVHESLKTRSATRTTVPRAQTPVRAPRETAPLLPERLHVTLPLPLTLGIFALWLVLSTYALARLIVGLARLRDALPLPIEYRDSMPQWLSANKGGRDVRLCVSDETDVPVAVGLFDAMILIPRTLLDHLSEPEVDQICLHELAHLRRADDWTNGAQRVIEALLGWNPAAQFIGQQLDLEREVACDDWVLSFVGKVRPYALCLTKMAETASWPRHPIPAPGVFATRKHISLRIERLLGAGRNIATTLSFGPAAVAVSVVAAIALLIGVVAPTIAAPVVVAPVAPLAAVHAVPPATAMHPVESKAQQPRVTARAAVPPAAPVKSVTHVETQVRTQVQTPATHVQKPAAPLQSTLTIHRIAQTNAAKAAQGDALARKINADTELGERIAEQVSVPAINSTLKRVSGLLPATIAQSSSGKNCNGCDYSNVNWQGRDLRGVSYTGVDLSNANLNGANLAGSSLNGVDFSNANLHGVSFRNARLTGCDFQHANLTGTDFTGATITGCQFRNAALGSAQMRDVLNHCKGCDFSGAGMEGLDLHGVRASGDDFGGADLRNVNFSGAELVGIDFGNAKMDGVNLSGATLNGCDLSRVDLSRVDLSKTKMIGTDLSRQHTPR
jgi:uncharacterized protein YjbI with pentapeptide repeats/beta-lactamase regulating signal transducer with metallopeptidase domain